MIPYGKQNINKKDLAAVTDVLRGNWITQGPAIKQFEEAVGKFVGADYAVAVSNGTTGLHITYLAAGIQAGDEIIMPANTFVATANAALYIGAKPVFVDIDPTYYNIDPQQIVKYITPKTKAIVAVHFAGHPCAMDEIFRIAKRHRLLVIEDAAHALGAEYKGRPIGNLNSAAVMFSFHPVKSITTGEGGMVMTPHEKIYNRLLSLRSHGIHKDGQGWNVMTELGFNYRITDFQAALGTSQLRRLPAFIRARRAVVQSYRHELKNCPGIILPSESHSVKSSWHLYVIQVQKPSDRVPLYKFLLSKGIGVNFHYPPVYSHPYYRQRGYRSVHLPNTDAYAKSAITLPIHTLLTKKEIRYISRTIHSFFQNR